MYVIIQSVNNTKGENFMFTLLLCLSLIIASVFIFKMATDKIPSEFKNAAAGVVGVLGVLIGLNGAFDYNDAGFCQHIRTITGSESGECKTGWYYSGFGRTTAWPWAITIAHSNNTEMEGSEVAGPYRVRMADNWTGDVTQTTRFEIPQDNEQFLEMVRKLRSPERLIATTLRPAVVSSLDSIANLYTMEQYYAGGQRDQFKTEFRDALEKGRAQVKQITVNDGSRKPTVSKAAASDMIVAQDTSEVGDLNSRRMIMQKVVVNGLEVREPHDYMEYGIRVASAILENLDPDDKFELQIQARKDAASRRIVAQEQRKEQEEQRLLAIQTGETNIAKKQAEAKVEQIQKTTDAETTKKLAIITAERMREEALVQKETAAINLDKARIDAQAKEVTADAAAYEKKALLEADGALKDKLEAMVAINRVWADAASKMNVPSTVMGGDGKTGNTINTTDAFMQMMMVKSAKDLQVDMKVK